MHKFTRLTSAQKNILEQASIDISILSESKLLSIAKQPLYAKEMSEAELVEFLTIANALYRGGHQIISDADYDGIYLEELKRRNPSHPFLHKVEPEAAFEGPKVILPVPMLSTEKKQNIKDVEAWIKSLKTKAKEIGIEPSTLQIRVTPKLDGFAAYNDGDKLYTRGDGTKGTDISRVFSRGLSVVGGIKGQGAGEIVVDREYFEKNLSEYFENTRNFQSTIIKEKELEVYVEDALKEKAVVFYPFEQLPAIIVPIDELIDNFETIVEKAVSNLKYDCDGIILESVDGELKKYMGSTAQYHRWQIAYKTKPETARVEVRKVVPQTSRSGRVTPVAELVPTKLSGATISRATAHHYGMVKKNGIGPGAVIELVRSGLVIPKIEKVIEKAEPDIPRKCPSCDEPLVWDGDNLLCPNVGECPAQITNTIEHFFNTLRNINGFGTATIDKLYEHKINNVCGIYKLSFNDFVEFGFGEKQSQNLVDELARSRREPLEDWRFLAAFGVHRLGRANCEHLLKHIKLHDVFDVTADDLVSKKIFANKTAQIIVSGLKKIRREFDCIIEKGFNIEYTKQISELRKEGLLSPISGKQVVFTGAMIHGTREEMERQARLLGAKVSSSVSGRTDYLVTGKDIGQSKIENAKKKNVAVITEEEYLKMIGSK